ncbi:FtsW/RodA/SpoVE family cell cycle protein [Parvularcula marina]|nr:putative peptidoglycan glycosyltransferase FtsW [Parvularcula marina]
MHDLLMGAPSARLAVLKDWWERTDRTLLALFGALVLIGIVLCTAAGPVAAMRKGIDNPFHFVERQLVFVIPAMLVMFGASLLSLDQVRRAGILIGAGALLLLFATLIIGPEIKGSTRWLTFGGVSLQPSEFFKPGFAVVTAWLLAEQYRDQRFPGGGISLGLYLIAVVVLIFQPDYGQLLLLTAMWGTIFFVAGWSWAWIAGLGGFVGGILLFGYRFAPHFKSRIDRFLSPDTGDTYQVDTALGAISGGGLIGHDFANNPSVKTHLPDAHTDFIFAVAGEEFGFLLCLIVLGIFCAIAMRCLYHAARAQSLFVRCAIVGLAAQLTFQALVNIGVTLGVLPAKGMTLPFISYGGSSLIAAALTAGLLLALTRRQEPLS